MSLSLTQQLCQHRRECYNIHHWPSTDYHKKPLTTTDRALNYLEHKAISVITIPMDVVGTVSGIAGMALSICTLGAFKVAVFAVTLGNIKCEFSTGFIWCGEKTVLNMLDLGKNIGELLYDAYSTVSYVVEKIQLLIERLRLFDILQPVVDFIRNRLEIGFQNARLCEARYENSRLVTTPPFLNWINAPTEKYRIGDEERLWTHILAHSAYSALNIPLNGITTLAGAVLTTGLGTAFVGKALLCAATNINIPIPTAVGPVLGGTVGAAHNALTDTAHCTADACIVSYRSIKVLAVGIYRAVEATGLIRVAGTITELLAYIPQACFN